MTESSTLQALPDRLELSAPASEEMLDLVHVLLEHLWQQHEEVPVAERMRVEMAVIEILANVIEHAFEVDSGRPAADERGDGRRFTITLGVTDAEVLIDLADNGEPAAIDLSRVTMPDEDAESGRGLALALASLTDLSFHSADGRNHWSMRCDLS
ncbi:MULTISPECIES: ATP-binding protein [unclassified Nocardioides]|uniref:ATP-binding protein n=1 Tax=unclassified Nocardioides TaxID=2615069 RepID=UPI0007028AF3|nr:MULTISPECIES: ATP-binding protein [unclassified Nocardioides]KQP64771.1 hypothetical protein ASF47_12795 [Nocardioides sp. Leaf285]KQQ43784.1 hypothetical protein ASF50_07840 [Nocardioides sp. Leaf307]